MRRPARPRPDPDTCLPLCVANRAARSTSRHRDSADGQTASANITTRPHRLDRSPLQLSARKLKGHCLRYPYLGVPRGILFSWQRASVLPLPRPGSRRFRRLPHAEQATLLADRRHAVIPDGPEYQPNNRDADEKYGCRFHSVLPFGPIWAAAPTPAAAARILANLRQAAQWPVVCPVVRESALGSRACFPTCRKRLHSRDLHARPVVQHIDAG
jgi:hypothetical protein